jgi:hypothetical protein
MTEEYLIESFEEALIGAVEEMEADQIIKCLKAALRGQEEFHEKQYKTYRTLNDFIS